MATAGQHATLAIHGLKDSQARGMNPPRVDQGLSSRSLLKVKEAVEQSDSTTQASDLLELQDRQIEAQNLRPDKDSEQAEALVEGIAHNAQSDDSRIPQALLGSSPIGQRNSPLGRGRTDRRHDIWQCSSQEGSPFRAVAGIPGGGGLAQGPLSNSHSGDSEQSDSPR